jgi:hypothetical protein
MHNIFPRLGLIADPGSSDSDMCIGRVERRSLISRFIDSLSINRYFRKGCQ